MTQDKLSLSALKAAQKQSDRPQFWQTLQEEQAQRLDAATQVWARREVGFVACAAIAFGLAGFAFGASETLSVFTEGPLTPGWMDGFILLMAAVFYALVSALVGALVGIVLVEPFSVSALRARLGAAKDQPAMCAKLVNQLDVPAVRSFRDKVTANGRELRLGDLLEMNRIADKERERQRQAERELNCRKLHGIDESGEPATSLASLA